MSPNTKKIMYTICVNCLDIFNSPRQGMSHELNDYSNIEPLICNSFQQKKVFL